MKSIKLTSGRKMILLGVLLAALVVVPFVIHDNYIFAYHHILLHLFQPCP